MAAMIIRQLPTLHTLRASMIPAGEDLPTRLVVFPWGTHETRRGKFIVGDVTAKVFEANQAKMRLDGRLALDFEHNTLPGTEAYKSSSEPRPIAALAVCKVIPGEGIVYEDIEWTPAGRRAFKGGHYQDLSPSPIRDHQGNVIGLVSVAMCRHGEVEGLTLHAAASPRIAEFLSALSAESSVIVFPSKTPPNKPAMKEALLKLLAALGITLSPEADDDMVTSALSTAAEKVATMKPKEDKPAEGMSADVAALTAEVQDLKKSLLIERATRDGKVIPLSAESIKLTPLSVLEDLVKGAKPGQVHQQARTTTGQPPEGDKAKPEALSAETLNLASQLGVTEDEIRKYGEPAV